MALRAAMDALLCEDDLDSPFLRWWKDTLIDVELSFFLNNDDRNLT
jgi:hypothetical protein